MEKSAKIMIVLLSLFLSLQNTYCQTNWYPSSGNVGIGTGVSPSKLLQVAGGDIDLNTSSKSYMIAGNPVLWQKGIVDNIFVGVGTGTNTTGDRNTFLGYTAGNTNVAGRANTFVGYRAGFSNTVGTITYEEASYNTFVGYKAGEFNTVGFENSFFGKKAGNANTEGNLNCFAGSHSGVSNTTGYSNTFIGAAAGLNTIDGFWNTALGNDAGHNNQDGYGNVFVGYNTGNILIGGTNTSGTNNTFVGSGAAPWTNGLTNASAIGYNARVSISDALILGYYNVNVGIGNDAPQNRLHINSANTSQAFAQITINL